MFTVGLIGAENSHARNFCVAINKNRLWDDVSIRYIYGADDPSQCKRLCEEYGITECASEDEVIEKSDGVVITYRKGSMHFEPVMKALNAGKLVFNDKPFATDLKEAEEIIRCAKEKGLPIAGGSSLKSLKELEKIRESIGEGSTVTISYSADPESDYDGYWFYGIHAAELCVALCGHDFTSIRAHRNKSVVIAHVVYKEKLCIIVTAPQSSDLVISVTSGNQTVCHKLKLNYQVAGPEEFVTMAKTGKAPWDYMHHIKSVELVGKIVKDIEII